MQASAANLIKWAEGLLTIPEEDLARMFWDLYIESFGLTESLSEG